MRTGISQSVTNCHRLKLEGAGMAENKGAGKKRGGIARKARRELEDQTGKSVVTGESFFAAGGRGEVGGGLREPALGLSMDAPVFSS